MITLADFDVLDDLADTDPEVLVTLLIISLVLLACGAMLRRVWQPATEIDFRSQFRRGAR